MLETEILLSNKRENSSEYLIHLFEFCGMDCVFCYQDHNSIVGISSIRGKFKELKPYLDMDKNPSIIFNVMGGELFDDALFTLKLAKDYASLLEDLYFYCTDYLKKSVHINLVTNMCFTNTEDFNNFLLLLKVPVTLSTSYDPVGRFNTNTFNIFSSNITEYQSLIKTISVVLTKQNIEKILKDDPVLDRLYTKFSIYFDYYSAEKSVNHLMPSDKDLLKFFYFALDKYPNSMPIRQFINGNPKLSCKCSTVILPNDKVAKCAGVIPPQIQDSYAVKLSLDSNADIEHNFVENKQCNTCEFFSRCGLSCFMLHANTERESIPRCVYKYVHEKVLYGKQVDVDSLIPNIIARS